MIYKLVSSEPIPSGYKVVLENEEGKQAQHNSYETTASAAERDAVKLHNSEQT